MKFLTSYADGERWRHGQDITADTWHEAHALATRLGVVVDSEIREAHREIGVKYDKIRHEKYDESGRLISKGFSIRVPLAPPTVQ